MPENTASPCTPPIIAAPASHPRRSRRRRIAWLVAAALALPIATKEGDVLFGQNFHTVVPGELFRSAQLSGSHLERRIQTESIRTVINLRGPNPGRDWYDDEVAVCERMGVKHVDVRMSAKELPTPAEAEVLMSALHEAPRPILVHCKNGADRSGLASAAYLIAERGTPASAASSDQLHLWYGHMPVGPTQAMDRFFTMFKASSGMPLPAWVNSAYSSLYEKQQAVHPTP